MGAAGHSMRVLKPASAEPALQPAWQASKAAGPPLAHLMMPNSRSNAPSNTAIF